MDLFRIVHIEEVDIEQIDLFRIVHIQQIDVFRIVQVDHMTDIRMKMHPDELIQVLMWQLVRIDHI